MISMYIEWDTDTIQSDGQYRLEELQDKVDLLARESDCDWDEDESAVFADSFIELKKLIFPFRGSMVYPERKIMVCM